MVNYDYFDVFDWLLLFDYVCWLRFGVGVDVPRYDFIVYCCGDEVDLLLVA